MCVKGTVEYSSVHRHKSQMSWVHIPAVILRQVLSVSDSVSLSVKWEFSCLKLCPMIVKIVLQKCSICEMPVHCTDIKGLEVQKGRQGAWSRKKEDEGQKCRWCCLWVDLLLYSWRHQGLLKWCHVTKGWWFCTGCSSGVHFRSGKCPPATVAHWKPGPFCFFRFLSSLQCLTGSHLAGDLRNVSVVWCFPAPDVQSSIWKGRWGEK